MRGLFSGKSIHQCFQLMYVAMYHTGCLSFKLENGVRLFYTQWSTIYAYIVRFILLASFVGGLFMKITDDELYDSMIGRLSPVVKFVMCFECTITAIGYTQTAFSLDATRKKHLKHAHHLQKLDDKLIKDFPNVNWNYNKNARKYTSMTTLLYTSSMVVSFGFVFSLAHCNCGLLSSFLIAFSYACLTSSPGIASFLYVAGMDMVRLRFRLLHKLFKINFIARSTNLRNDTKDLRKLKKLEYYFKEYSYMIPGLNEIFGNVSGVGMFYDFAILTNMGFLLCSKAIESESQWNEYVFIIVFIMPRIYKVIFTNVYGHLADMEVCIIPLYNA